MHEPVGGDMHEHVGELTGPGQAGPYALGGPSGALGE